MAQDNASPPTDPRLRGNPGTPDFQVDYYPFYLLNRTVGRYNGIIEAALRAIGVDLPSWRVLMILGESSPRSIGQVAETAVIAISTMTRMIQRMEAAGLVRCQPRPNDNRVTEVYLTDQGADMLARTRAIAAPVFEQAIDGFSAGEFQQLVDLLNRLYRNLTKPAR